MAALKLSTLGLVALRTSGESSFQSRMVCGKTVLIDIVIGFYDSEFCRMVLSCANGGLTLNIVRYGYGCDSVLNFLHIYEATLLPTLLHCWPLKLL